MAETTDKVELQRQLDELKRELRDTRTNTINWWLAVNGFILTFFGIVVVIGGFVGFTRFQQIENEARSILVEARGILGQIGQTKRAGDQLMAELKRDRELLVGDEVAKSEPSQETIQEAQRETAGSSPNAEAYNYRGIVKRNQGLPSEAITDYDQAIKLRPDYPEAYNNRGVAKAKLGLFFEAITDYDQAIKLRPDYPEAYNNRGNVKQVFGRFKEALADYDQAVKLRPAYSNAHNNRAIAKERMGLVIEALTDYDQAIKLQPESPEAYYNRGKLRIASGFKIPGRADLESALELAQKTGHTDVVTKVEQMLRRLDIEGTP